MGPKKVLHPEDMFLVLDADGLVKNNVDLGRVIIEKDFPEALKIIRKMDSINYSGFLEEKPY